LQIFRRMKKQRSWVFGTCLYSSIFQTCWTSRSLGVKPKKTLKPKSNWWMTFHFSVEMNKAPIDPIIRSYLVAYLRNRSHHFIIQFVIMSLHKLMWFTIIQPKRIDDNTMINSKSFSKIAIILGGKTFNVCAYPSVGSYVIRLWLQKINARHWYWKWQILFMLFLILDSKTLNLLDLKFYHKFFL